MASLLAWLFGENDDSLALMEGGFVRHKPLLGHALAQQPLQVGKFSWQ